uniref:Dynamin_N domain-containing protein n=1 Tax=Macrostomum lignano TaxID=282301 RepID=A0A1I8G8J1_9PLAT
MEETAQKLDRADYEVRFQSSRRDLVAALRYRESRFVRLAEYLGELRRLMCDLKIECEATDEDTKLDELDELDEILQSQLTLSLIVFGRSNTGKSTLLNQLLRDWQESPASSRITGLFPTAEHTCTARLTCTSHGPSRTVSIQDVITSQAIVDTTAFEDSRELREYIDLKGNEREDRNTAMLVKVSLPNELLRYNLQLVDSPGMGENAQMNETVRNFLNGAKSAIVVYTVNGTEGYKPEPDTENIRFLMEEHSSMQKVFVANRIDCCIKSYYKNLCEEVQCEDSSDEEEVVKSLENDIEGFQYSAHCQEHMLKRMGSVMESFSQYHPGCITPGSETALLGVSAKSVENFLSNNWPVPHPPYLDSFLELEARIAALVYANARQKLTDAMAIMKRLLMLASVHLLAFKLSSVVTSSLTEMPMELMSRALRVIKDTYERISKALLSVAAEDSLLDLSDPESELNVLKNQFARDGAKMQAAADVSLVMRQAEAKLIASLTQGKNREFQAAVRLLCSFKDILVSHLKAELRSKYKEVLARSVLSHTAHSVMEGLCSSAEEFHNDLAIIKCTFEPNDTEFGDLCASHLVDGMRQALPRLVRTAEFAQLVASKSPDKRTRQLDYFLAGIDLRKLTGEAIELYCAQLCQKKTDIEDRLTVQLDELRQRSFDSVEKKLRLKPLKRDLTVLLFKLTGMDTELRWNASNVTRECEQVRQCQQEVSNLRCPQLGSRRRCILRPRISGGRAADLLCRCLHLPADCLKRMASSAMRLRSKLPSSVQFAWFFLDEPDCDSGTTETAATDKADDVQLLLGVLTNEASCRFLSELHPHSITDVDRLVWMRSLLMCQANFASAELHYRPMDYRPSNVLIVDMTSDPAGGGDGAGSGAMPDPTHLLAEAGQAAESASLAACIVTLFGYTSNTAEHSPAGWNEHYEAQLQRAVSNPETFLTYLPSCLGGRQNRSLISCVSDCVSACLAGLDSAKVEALSKSVQRLLPV